MSREQSGKSPILVLAWRFSLFLVTPSYLFVLWVFHPVLSPQVIPRSPPLCDTMHESKPQDLPP